MRIRVLELLLDGPRPVHELRAAIEVEPSNLSQQLAVLRRSGLVESNREGSTVLYTISTPEVAEMMVAARRVLATVLTDRQGLLDELRTS